MGIHHHVEQATTSFKTRRSRWHQYTPYGVEVLELVERTASLSEAERAELKEYLLYRKREQKAALEAAEKREDYLERASLTVAVTFFSVVTWLLTEFSVQGTWREILQIGAFMISVAGWGYTRAKTFRTVVEVRRSLAKLGKVD